MLIYPGALPTSGSLPCRDREARDGCRGTRARAPRARSPESFPPRRALLDEGLHAFERSGVHHVARDGAARRLIGSRDAGLRLAVEELLTEGDRNARLAHDRGRERLDLRIEGVRLDDPVHEAALAGLRGVDEIARHQHLEGLLERHVARERYGWRRAEKPEITPLTAKRASRAATARSHCATSWQPAAVAMPCTRAITGIGNRRSVNIMREHCVKRRW